MSQILHSTSLRHSAFKCHRYVPLPQETYPFVVEVLSKTTSRPSAKTGKTLPLRRLRYSFQVSVSLSSNAFWAEEWLNGPRNVEQVSDSSYLFVRFGSFLLRIFEKDEPFERPLPIQDNIKAENTYTVMARVGLEPAIPTSKRHRSLCMLQSERWLALWCFAWYLCADRWITIVYTVTTFWIHTCSMQHHDSSRKWQESRRGLLQEGPIFTSPLCYSPAVNKLERFNGLVDYDFMIIFRERLINRNYFVSRFKTQHKLIPNKDV
jgi:hypothetical protein